MGKVLADISPELAEWIAAQKIFFVGSAPLAEDGHVNCSPKGGDSLRVLGPLSVVYQDYTGSGAETAAHLRENGRIVVMFCAFDGPPRIVRLHGRGRYIDARDPQFPEMSALFPPNAGTRGFVHVEVSRVASSCGFSIPYFDYREPRDTLDKWSSAKSPEDMRTYRRGHNHSIDGLPAQYEE